METNNKLVPCCNACGAISKKGFYIKENKYFIKTTAKLSHCTRCYFVQYCDSECQKEDWKNHQNFCFPIDKQLEPFNSKSNEKVLKEIIIKQFLPLSNAPGTLLIYRSKLKEGIFTNMGFYFDTKKETEKLHVGLFFDMKVTGASTYWSCKKLNLEKLINLTNFSPNSCLTFTMEKAAELIYVKECMDAVEMMRDIDINNELPKSDDDLLTLLFKQLLDKNRLVLAEEVFRNLSSQRKIELLS